MRVPKIAVTFSEAELKQVRKDAGLVPLSTWIRHRALSSPESEKVNGSASHQDVSGVRDRKVSRRRTAAAGPRSPRSDSRRISGRDDTPRVASTIRPVPNSSSVGAVPIVQSLTRENFAEKMAEIAIDEVDRWARSLPPEVLPSHDGSAAAHNKCLCINCLTRRKTIGISYGHVPKGKR